MRALDRIPRIHDSAGDDVRQRLRDLPCEGQPPYDWTEFRRRARERTRTKGVAVKWEHAAAAAGITVLVASMAMWSRADHHPVDVASSGMRTVPITESAPASAGSERNPEDLSSRMQEARQARRWLAELPEEPAVVRVGPRFIVSSLEDRIAWVDDALSDAQFAPADAGRMRTLQLERARLVSSLAQVRYAETLAAQVP